MKRKLRRHLRTDCTGRLARPRGTNIGIGPILLARTYSRLKSSIVNREFGPRDTLLATGAARLPVSTQAEPQSGFRAPFSRAVRTRARSPICAMMARFACDRFSTVKPISVAPGDRMVRKATSPPTIEDVARECGVGKMTVSRVINGGKLVSPARRRGSAQRSGSWATNRTKQLVC